MPSLSGQSTDANVPGVLGESTVGEGVRGASHSQHGGVVGVNDNGQGGAGVFGDSQNGEGVHGTSHSQHGGVVGVNDNGQGGAGVWGESQNGEGVFGISHSAAHVGVFGRNTAGGPAGFFEGSVMVTGDLKVKGVSFGPDQIHALNQQVAGLQQQVAELTSLINGARTQEIADVANINGRLAAHGI